MRLTPVLAAVAVLGLGVGAARADDRVGTIRSVDGRTFTLGDGNAHHPGTDAASSAWERLKPGQKVWDTYDATFARMQPESSYINSLVEIAHLKKTNLSKGLAYPSMDASRPARGFVASGVRVSAAAIHPVSTTTGRRPRRVPPTGSPPLNRAVPPLV